MERARVAVNLWRIAVISWVVAFTSWIAVAGSFYPVGFVLGAYVLGVVVLGAIVGTAVYGLTLLLKRLLNQVTTSAKAHRQVSRTNSPRETHKRTHDNLDPLADERRRDRIFGVQRIQSFLPSSDE